MQESSQDGRWDSFLARPLDREMWNGWLEAEKQQVVSTSPSRIALQCMKHDPDHPCLP